MKKIKRFIEKVLYFLDDPFVVAFLFLAFILFFLIVSYIFSRWETYAPLLEIFRSFGVVR